MTKKKEDPEIVKARTLLLNTVEGDIRITVPAGGRVTFGPTIPYQRKPGYATEAQGYSLRVYETPKNDSLIAVFGGVKSFRDIALPHMKLVIREAGKSIWKSDEEGYKVETEVNRAKEWTQLEDGLTI